MYSPVSITTGNKPLINILGFSFTKRNASGNFLLSPRILLQKPNYSQAFISTILGPARSLETRYHVSSSTPHIRVSPQRSRNQQIHTKLTDRSREIAGSFSRARQKENKERIGRAGGTRTKRTGVGKGWRSASNAPSVCLNIRH